MGYPTRLGDVTTPDGGGAGVLSQIWSWITASPANAANSPAIVQQWQADVKARGNVATRYPFPSDSVAQNGDLAERQDLGDSYNYISAPLDVTNADRITRGLSTLAPVTGQVAAAAQAGAQAVQDTIKLAVQQPRKLLADSLGISPGIVTAALVLGAGAFVLSRTRRRS